MRMLPALAALALPASAFAQGAPVQYDLSFPNAVHHEARITATWTDLPAAPLRLRMSRSSPGRYAVHEFAKNVYDVTATDAAGRPLAIDRTDPYGWSVPNHAGTVRVTYTLYADHGDGTYAQVDATHAHLNMPATLIWATGQDARPATLRFHAPDPKWKIATQLAPTADPAVFTAPNLQYLMDSPVELSDHMVREWREAGRTYRLAVHHPGTAADMDRFADKAKRIVRTQIAIFGAAPRYDTGTYTFIADYMPQITGDGMEHRNSTIITDTRSFDRANFAQLGTLSHEFFHSWNVERIRPAELEPFDFTRANPTPSLWLAEGFTSYYGNLAVRRAGESSVDDFLQGLGRTLGAVVVAPARRHGGPMEMSLRAPFVDAAKSIDPTNPNIFVSYYGYGAVIALALDLELRQRGLTLDAYMRALWTAHGDPERPYTTADLRAALAGLTRDRAFADRFFAQSIAASELPDFAPLLAQAGLTLRPAAPRKGWLGVEDVAADGPAVTLTQPPAPDTPLYVAGVERGDRILSLGRLSIANTADWQAALARLSPGDTVAIRYLQRGTERAATLTAAADPALEIVRAEATGGRLTPAQRRFRTAWLGAD